MKSQSKALSTATPHVRTLNRPKVESEVRLKRKENKKKMKRKHKICKVNSNIIIILMSSPFSFDWLKKALVFLALILCTGFCSASPYFDSLSFLLMHWDFLFITITLNENDLSNGSHPHFYTIQSKPILLPMCGLLGRPASLTSLQWSIEMVIFCILKAFHRSGVV